MYDDIVKLQPYNTGKSTGVLRQSKCVQKHQGEEDDDQRTRQYTRLGMKLLSNLQKLVACPMCCHIHIHTGVCIHDNDYELIIRLLYI